MKTYRKGWGAAALFLLVLAVPVFAKGQPEAKKADAGTGALSKDLVTLTLMRDDPASQPLRQDSLVLQYLEKKLNIRVKIEATPAASYAEKKKLLIATDKLPDISLVTQKDIMDFSASGVFLNISGYLDQMPNFKAVYAKYPEMRKLQIDDKILGFPLICRWQTRGGQLPVVRQDLLKKYGIAVPKTFDEFRAMLAVFKKNEPDKIPMTNRKGGSTSGTQKVLDCMAYPLGSGSKLYYDHDVDGGTFLFGPATQQFKAVLTYLNGLYKDGLMDKDYATNTVDLWKEKMSSGKALSFFDNAGFAEDFNLALNAVQPGASMQPILSLKNSLGQTRNWFYDKHWPESAYVISDRSKNKDVAIKLMDWCFSEEGCNTTGFGVLGETYQIVDGKPRILDAVLEKYKNAKTNSPSYEIQSALGVGYLSFAPYIDQGAGYQMTLYMQEGAKRDAYIALWSSIENDPGMREPVINPPISSADAARVKTLQSAVENILMQEWDKYIMGLEPIANYDKVIQKARDAGAAEIEAIYNKANKKYK